MALAEGRVGMEGRIDFHVCYGPAINIYVFFSPFYTYLQSATLHDQEV